MLGCELELSETRAEAKGLHVWRWQRPRLYVTASGDGSGRGLHVTATGRSKGRGLHVTALGTSGSGSIFKGGGGNNSNSSSGGYGIARGSV